LLEGLEISEVDFSETLINKDFRTDSDFWTKKPKKNPKLIYVTIGSILKVSQYGISIEMNENNKGYPIYRMNEIHNMLCDFEVNKCADIQYEEFEKFSLNDRDVLFNRTNSYEWVGRTGLFKKQAGKNFIFASYLVRFIPNENKVLPEYLVAFLSSAYGIWDIRRRARHSINQTNVNPEEVKEIQIPLLMSDIQRKIKLCFDRAAENLLESKQLYTQAETLLLNALGMADFSLSTENVNIKSFKESFLATGRFDAEYYQPKYEQIEQAIISFSGDVRLKDLVGFVHTGEYAEQYLPKANGLKFYIRSTNINNGLINDDEDYYVDPVGFTKFVQQGDIVTARVGTLGIFGAVDAKTSGSIYSDNVLCFRLPNTFNADVYTLWFNSKLNFELIDRLARGSVQQRLNQETLKDLLVPIIATEIQSQIANLVQDSFTLKAKSERLLEVAKRAVEIAIEQDEAAGMAYIEANIE